MVARAPVELKELPSLRPAVNTLKPILKSSYSYNSAYYGRYSREEKSNFAVK